SVFGFRFSVFGFRFLVFGFWFLVGLRAPCPALFCSVLFCSVLVVGAGGVSVDVA
ncbi:MAG: hypothetical protein RL215_491, partial [Planctomycetota bacterium]